MPPGLVDYRFNRLGAMLDGKALKTQPLAIFIGQRRQRGWKAVPRGLFDWRCHQLGSRQNGLPIRPLDLNWAHDAVPYTIGQIQPS